MGVGLGRRPFWSVLGGPEDLFTPTEKPWFYYNVERIATGSSLSVEPNSDSFWKILKLNSDTKHKDYILDYRKKIKGQVTRV